MTPRVYFMDLPCRIKGYVSKNEDDTHTIILNSKLSIEQNMKTFLHELSHIENNDFEKPTVNEAEGIKSELQCHLQKKGQGNTMYHFL